MGAASMHRFVGGTGAWSLVFVLVRGTRVPPNLLYACIGGSSGWASVSVLHWKSENDLGPNFGTTEKGMTYFQNPGTWGLAHFQGNTITYGTNLP